MLDAKFVRQNPDKVRENVRWRGLDPNLVDKWLDVDKKRQELTVLLQSLRHDRNEFHQASKQRPSEAMIRRQRQLRRKIQENEKKLKEITRQWQQALNLLPNMSAEDVPHGRSGADNVVVRSWGEKPRFGFPPRDHLQLGEALGIIDVNRTTKISGSRFGSLLREAALLEFALIRYSLNVALKEGFVPIIPPVLIKKDFEIALGYSEHGGWEEMYLLDKDDLVLAATTEHPLVAGHSGDIFQEKELPRRYIGFSSAFRREAGSYGRDTRGIFRVHQFDQTEFISFTWPEKSDEEHEFLVNLEEKLVRGLKLPYRVVKMCTADLAQPQRRRYDIEVWLPSQKQYRETHSASNCDAYQARRLNIKLRRAGGKKECVHILNATGFALGRMIIAILENYQQKDGSVFIPEVLRDLVGKKKIG